MILKPCKRTKGLTHVPNHLYIQQTPILTVPHVFAYVRLLSTLIFHQSFALATGKACNARRRHQRFDFQASRVSWVKREAIPRRVRHAPHVKIYEDVLSRMCNADVGNFRKNLCQNCFRPSCKEFNDMKAISFFDCPMHQCIPMPLQHVWNRSSSQSQSSARLHLPLPSLPLLPMSLAPDMTHMTAVFSVCC